MLLRAILTLPRARRWLRETIAAGEPNSRSVADCRFARFSSVFSPELLELTRLTAVDRVPQPPLQQWGFDDKGLLAGDAAGITLDRMIFVRTGLDHDESLVFHELIHAIQWRTLGVDRFLALYGLLLLKPGYAANPLELMAYQLQTIFDEEETLPNLEAVVARRAQELFEALRAQSAAHRCALSMLR